MILTFTLERKILCKPCSQETHGEAGRETYLKASSWLPSFGFFFFLNLIFNLILSPLRLDANFQDGVAVQSLSRVRIFVTPWTAARQAPCPSPTPRACSNSCPLSRWCHPTISASVVPFSFRLQSFPASGFFQCPFFASGGQSIGVSATMRP